MFSLRPGMTDASRGPAPVLLYILHSGNMYGTERMALATVQGMVEYGHRIVFAPPVAGRNSVLAAAQNAGLRTVSFMTRLGLLWKLLPVFIRHRSIDVIGTGVVHSLACHYLSRAFGVHLRQVHVAHGGTPTSLDQKHALNRIPCTLVAVSDFVRDKLIQGGVHAEKITVIENFLGAQELRQGSERPSYDASVIDSRQVDRKRIRVSIVSRVDAFKRVDLLVGSDLPMRFPDFVFDIYGTGDQFDVLKQRAASMPNVHLHGYVTDVVQRLADADVLLHLCPEEPFGLVILEAFRARLLVVGPDTGGIGQLIDEGVTGLRFKSQDVEDLGRVLAQLREMDGAQMQRIANAGATKLKEHYTQAKGVIRYRAALAESSITERVTTLSPLTASAPERPSILCVMRMPPDPNGHGGSQRAWRLLRALRHHGDVHFVLIYREQDLDCVRATLAQVAPLTASVTRISIPDWQPRNRKRLGIVPGRVWDLFTMGSQDAPTFTAATLRWIADQLPCRHVDIAFAGRLCSATVLQALMDRKLVSARLRLVDYDNLMAKFAPHRPGPGFYRSAMKSIESKLVARSEAAISRRWDAVSVCTDTDVATLEEMHPGRNIAKIPNAVSRRRLPPREPDGSFRILFTGNLGSAPNIEGLTVFVKEAWPALSAAVPEARLTLVGLNPNPALIEMARANGFELHANVPSLEPHYEDCDVVIAPILFGSGTRIKVLEALAYGRAVVSTSLGAEGLGIDNGRDIVLADRMDEFAVALKSLARDPGRRQAVAEAGHAFQQQWYTPQAFNTAVDAFLASGAAFAKTLV